MHAADVLWPVLITLFTEGPNSPFFVLFAFVLLAAAYRWGFRGTVMTAVAAVGLLFFEAVGMTSRAAAVFPELQGELELNRFIMRATYLLIMGVLLGYLAEQQKRLRAEASAVARVLGRAQSVSGLRETLRVTLDEIVRIFGAERALIAFREEASGQAYLWEARLESERLDLELLSASVDASHSETYFFPVPGPVWYANRHDRPGGEQLHVVALDAGGKSFRAQFACEAASFHSAFPFRSLLGLSSSVGNEWHGRLFLFDPLRAAGRETDLRFFQHLIERVIPAVHNAYLTARLRSQAGALERARVARELHDGAIQSLIAAQMHIEAIRRGGNRSQGAMVDKLDRAQQVLGEEVQNLRELMERMKSVDVGPGELLESLADRVEKFERETGISARFVSDAEAIALRPRLCREVVRIVQESLVNVRRHSGARNVRVHLSFENGSCKIVIDDDGRGFPFSGRLSMAGLDTERKGPVVIKERVRSIGGELTIESTPGRGARLEISLPRGER